MKSEDYQWLMDMMMTTGLKSYVTMVDMDTQAWQAGFVVGWAFPHFPRSIVTCQNLESEDRRFGSFVGIFYLSDTSSHVRESFHHHDHA